MHPSDRFLMIKTSKGHRGTRGQWLPVTALQRKLTERIRKQAVIKRRMLEHRLAAMFESGMMSLLPFALDDLLVTDADLAELDEMASPHTTVH